MQVSVRTGPVRWHGVGALTVWLIVRALIILGRLCYAAACHPRTTAAVIGSVLVARFVTSHTTAALTLFMVAMAVGEAWHLASPGSFRRQVTLRALTVWRSAAYRRHWQVAVCVAELNLDEHLPRLQRVRCLEATDVLQVRGVLGQRFTEWEAGAPMVAHVLGATDVRVHRGDDRRLTLELGRGRVGRSWNRDRRLDLEQPS